MDLKSLKWPISFTTSLIANILYYGLLIPGMLTYPNYSPFTHSVSSIGAVTRNPGWFFFSICLILIGIFLILFYYGLNKWYTDEPNKKKSIRIVQILGILDSISLILIAIFPTDTQHPPHEFWSIMDFLFIILATFALNFTLWNHPNFDKRIAYYGFVLCGICLSYGLLAIVYSEIWFIEHLSFITALFYVLLIGIKMLKNKM